MSLRLHTDLMDSIITFAVCTLRVRLFEQCRLRSESPVYVLMIPMRLCQLVGRSFLIPALSDRSQNSYQIVNSEEEKLDKARNLKIVRTRNYRIMHYVPC